MRSNVVRLGFAMLGLGVCSSPCLAQQPSWNNTIETPDLTYQQIVDAYEAEYANGHIVDSVSAREDIARFVKFWKDRVNCDDPTKQGKLQSYVDMLKEQVALGPYCPDNVNSTPWELVGPEFVASAEQLHHMGHVCALWADEGETPLQTILAGTNCSGLWRGKLLNGGWDWKCLTDGLRMPGMGIQAVDVDPGSGKIFIGTGMAYRHGGWSAGAWCSADDGASWDPMPDIPSNSQGGTAIWDLKVIGEHVYVVQNRRVMRAMLTADHTETGAFVDVTNGLQLPDNLKFNTLSGFEDELGNTVLLLTSLLQGATEGAKVYSSLDEGASWNDVTSEVTSGILAGWTRILGSHWRGPTGTPLQSPWGLNVSVPLADRYVLAAPDAPVVGPERVVYTSVSGTYSINFLNGSPMVARFRYELAEHVLLRVYAIDAISGEQSEAVNEPIVLDDQDLHPMLLFETNTHTNGQVVEVDVPLIPTSNQRRLVYELEFEPGYTFDGHTAVRIYTAKFFGDRMTTSFSTSVVDQASPYWGGYVSTQLAGGAIEGTWIYRTRDGLNFEPYFNLGAATNINEDLLALLKVSWNGTMYTGGSNNVSGAPNAHMVRPLNTSVPLTNSDVLTEQLTSYHADTRAIHVHRAAPGGTESLLIGDDGGVSHSTNAGTSGVEFASLNGSSFPITQVYGFGVDENETLLRAGVHDNGTLELDMSTGMWTKVGGGDGGDSRSWTSRKAENTGALSMNNALAYFSQTNIDNTGCDRQHAGSAGNAYLGSTGTTYVDQETDELRAYISHRKLYRMDCDNPGATEIEPDSEVNSYIGPIAVHPQSDQVIVIGPDNPAWGSPLGRFMRTTDGGQTWVDLGQAFHDAGTQDNLLENQGLMAIVIDPDIPYTQPATLYVARDGFSTTGTDRVFKSTDNGVTWADMSEGLPFVPVNTLAIQPGSGGILYAGTENGVYVFDPNVGAWQCFSEELPVCIVTSLQVNSCSGKLYAGTYGRSIWRTDLYQPDRVTELVVSQDDEWTTKRTLNQTVRVTAGHTLTISSEVHMYPHRRIIVEPNARLVINGGTVTSQCMNSRWMGIEVVGNALADQLGSPLANHQGRLLITNGGKVENAEVGALAGARIPVGNTYAYDFSKSGGVIVASQSSFVNCQRAVMMLPWPAPNAPISMNTVNRSSFTLTNFIVDSDYPDEAPFYSHIGLLRVYGLKFVGCQFKNTRPDADYAATGSDALGDGILSLDSRFTITSSCPCNQYLEPGHVCTCPQRTRFEGLDHAIQAANAVTTRNFSVRDADFVHNICGVMATGVVGPTVRNNHFVMGGRSVELTSIDEFTWDMHRAIFTTECYATRIDDNTMEMTTSPQAEAEGVITGYVRDHSDIVFRNTAIGLKNGFVGEGVNADPDNKTHVGLWWLCNTNDGNEQDLWCRYPQGIQPFEMPDATVRTIQGAINRPADNAFDNVAAEGDFKSDNTHNTIDYYHRDDVAQVYVPVEYTPDYVAPVGSTTIPLNNCAQRVLIIQVVGDHDNGTVANGMAVLASEKLAYGNTRYLYDQLIDGGSTDEVVQEIMHSWPNDAWDLRNYLMSKSPFLSVDALRQAVLRNVMPATMLSEVLVANPEATKTEGFFAWMQEWSGFPLPGYLADLVVASWDERTYRFALESTMAEHHANMTMAADLVIQEYQNDTVHEPVDSLRVVWTKVRTTAARYAEALLRMQRGQFTAAQTLVQSIPSEHDLRDPEELERQRMLALITFVQAVYASGRTEYALTPAEVTQLEAIINAQYDRPAAWAQNLLCVVYDHCRAPLTGGEGGGKRAIIQADEKPDAPRIVKQPRLWAQPNPANTFTTLHYLLPPANGPPFRIEVRDVTGKELTRFQVSGEQGQVLWDTRQVGPGTYTAMLVAGDAHMAVERVVVRP